MVNYTLIRSNRKTIAIYITVDANVEVKAPLRAKKSDIDKFVESKREWIMKNQRLRSEYANRKENFNITYGSKVLYRGSLHIVTANDFKLVGFSEHDTVILPSKLSNLEIKQALISLYKQKATTILIEKALYYSKLMGVTPSSIKVNSAKTRWGSCSGKNSINFSWLLILADDSAIDYVVVHELAHIIEHNHSKKFWLVVEKIMPDYKTKQQGLKKLQKILAGQDWNE